MNNNITFGKKLMSNSSDSTVRSEVVNRTNLSHLRFKNCSSYCRKCNAEIANLSPEERQKVTLNKFGVIPNACVPLSTGEWECPMA